MPTLTNFSAPKLLSAEQIDMNGLAAGSTVDLSRLRSVGEILPLTGDFSRIKLNSLYNASTLAIYNGLCDTTPDWENTVGQELDIDLPSLEIAGRLGIGGNITSISAPRLQTMTSEGLYLNMLSDTPVALSFPRLHFAGTAIDIAGPVANLDFPMLRNMTSLMIFTPWQPIHFKLVAESLHVVELEGKFQRYSRHCQVHWFHSRLTRD
ncbi:hypothetical protein BJX61DRAFT_525101 [Aspergillus egyptiacus]|nr:hypothetical protein BJX61DRAFT_525101 [Aspergillus egyptiacus]